MTPAHLVVGVPMQPTTGNDLEAHSSVCICGPWVGGANSHLSTLYQIKEGCFKIVFGMSID